MKSATFGEVFAVREFRVLFGSFVLLIGGDVVKMLALSVLVYERTGSPGLSAAAYMAGWLPFILGGLFLLSLADRVPPRALMIAGELVRAVTCLVLAYAGLPVWGLLALVLVTGLFSPVFFAARAAMLPEVLPGDAFVLGRSVLNVASASAQIVGLAAAGAFLGFAGPSGALAVTAVLSLAAVVVLRVGLPHRPARGADQVARGSAVRETLRVNRRLVADRRVRGLLLAGWLPCVCLAGAEAMVVPYLGGQGRAGVVLAAAAGGAGVPAGTAAAVRGRGARGRARTGVRAAVGRADDRAGGGRRSDRRAGRGDRARPGDGGCGRRGHPGGAGPGRRAAPVARTSTGGMVLQGELDLPGRVVVVPAAWGRSAHPVRRGGPRCRG
ncbi:MFS transporter [Nonomuraea sp. NPDC050153]|uniref:MFS transporter n=1 Tax=Nonomuraea sp. NPDC050153 TaxID=3364359 RepID=UPI00379D5867